MSIFGSKKPRELLRDLSSKDRYTYLKAVGEGGISKVESCFDTRLNRVVARKELKSENLNKFELVQFFINEAKLVGYLDHPGVAPVFDSFLEKDGRPCYTMKLCQGSSLKELLEKGNRPGTSPLPLPQVLEVFLKLCQTMAYVHDKGVLHLDLKPDNIIVGTYGEVTVLDWGSARLYQSKRFFEHLERTTENADLAKFDMEREGIVLGTPQYMSPEQITAPRETLTCASDVFSAGIVLYEMLTGEHPFVAAGAEEIMDKILTATPRPPHEVNCDVPRMFSQICLRMLEKKPAQRYPGFHPVLEDLAHCQGVGETFPTREFGPGEIIFREGDPGDYAFMVLSGQVEILKDVSGESKVIAVMKEGQVVGELAIISKQPRTASARAQGATRIRVLSKDDIHGELDKLSPWVGQMITNLSNRFIEVSDRLVEIQQAK